MATKPNTTNPADGLKDVESLTRDIVALQQKYLDQQARITEENDKSKKIVEDTRALSAKNLADQFKGVSVVNDLMKARQSIHQVLINNDKQLLKILADQRQAQMSMIQGMEVTGEGAQAAIENEKNVLRAIRANIEETKANLALHQELLKNATGISRAWTLVKEAASSTWGAIKLVLGATKIESNKLLDTFTELTGGPLRAFVALLKLAVDRFSDLDKAAEKFRKATGLTIGQTGELRRNAEKLNAQYQDMGIGIEEAYKASEQLVIAFGGMNTVANSSVELTALLAANLNVSEASTAAVLAKFQGLGGLSKEFAENIIKVGAHLTKDTPISFAKVMDDIAKSSDDVHFLLGHNPQLLLKTAIQARALGVDLNAVASVAKHLLDFQTSVNDEMNASALLGKSLTFQRARQLAFEDKIADAAKESLRVVQSAGDWNKMNMYQREALAKASGMELKDLNKMVALERIRNSGTAEGAKLRALDAQLKAMDDINMSADEKLVADAESEIKQRQMQGILTNISNMMKGIFLNLATALTPLVATLMKIIIPMLKVVGVLIQAIGFFLIPIGDLFDYIGDKVSGIFGTLDAWTDGITHATEWLRESTNGWVKTLRVVVGVLGTVLAITTAIYLKKKATAALDAAIPVAKALGGGVIGKTLQGLDGASGGIGKLMGTGISQLMKGFASGMKELGDPKVMMGAICIGLLAGSIWLFAKALNAFTGIDWAGVGLAAIALGVVAVAAAIFGQPEVAAVIALGAGVIALLGLSLIPFAAAAWIAGKASQELATGLASSIKPIKDLTDIGGTGFATTAAGIYEVSSALASFGCAAAVAGIGSLVGRICGEDPIEKLKTLASLSSDLTSSALAIQQITSEFSSFGTVDAFSKSIDGLAESIKTLNHQLVDLSLLSVAAMPILAAASFARKVTEIPAAERESTRSNDVPTSQTNNRDEGGMAKKLDEFIQLMKSGVIKVEMDHRVVGKILAA